MSPENNQNSSEGENKSHKISEKKPLLVTLYPLMMVVGVVVFWYLGNIETQRLTVGLFISPVVMFWGSVMFFSSIPGIILVFLSIFTKKRILYIIYNLILTVILLISASYFLSAKFCQGIGGGIC